MRQKGPVPGESGACDHRRPSRPVDGEVSFVKRRGTGKSLFKQMSCEPVCQNREDTADYSANNQENNLSRFAAQNDCELRFVSRQMEFGRKRAMQTEPMHTPKKTMNPVVQ